MNHKLKTSITLLLTVLMILMQPMSYVMAAEEGYDSLEPETEIMEMAPEMENVSEMESVSETLDEIPVFESEEASEAETLESIGISEEVIPETSAPEEPELSEEPEMEEASEPAAPQEMAPEETDLEEEAPLQVQDVDTTEPYYSVNGIDIPVEGFLPGSYHDNCWAFAQSIYNILWNGASFSSFMGTPDDLMRVIEAPSARLITVENTKNLILHSRPGAVIRMSYSLIEDGDYDGHSIILVSRDEYGLTVYHGNWSRTVLLEYLTWEQFVRKFAGYGYVYFKYIKWPGAPEYDPHVHHTTYVEPVEATYESTGHIGYYFCEECGKYFSDAEGMDPLTEEDLELDYVDPETATVTDYYNSLAGITIQWEPVDGADSYAIYRKANGEAKWTILATFVEACTFLDKTAVSGVKYQYAVRGYNSVSKKYGTYAKPGFEAYCLNAPENVKAVLNLGSITISWKQVPGANRYYVYRRTEGGSWQVLTNTESVSFVDRTAVSGTSYYYTVRAYHKAGKILSAYRNPGVNVLYMRAPSMTTKDTENGIALTWNEVDGADSYRIYRKTEGEGWQMLVSGVKGDSFLDKTAVSGTTYIYTIRSYNQALKAFSNSNKNGFAGCWLSCPGLKSAQASGGKITVKWDVVSGASRYYVYRKTAGESWKVLGSVTSCSYADSTAKKGVSYTYTVRAYQSKTGLFSTFEKPGLSAAVK